jgi:hypothetical protein
MYGEWSGRHIRAVRSRICMCRMREKIVRVLDSHRVFVLVFHVLPGIHVEFRAFLKTASFPNHQFYPCGGGGGGGHFP